MSAKCVKKEVTDAEYATGIEIKEEAEQDLYQENESVKIENDPNEDFWEDPEKFDEKVIPQIPFFYFWIICASKEARAYGAQAFIYY